MDPLDRWLTSRLACCRNSCIFTTVVEGEPDVPAALRALDNVVITPHTGGLSRVAFDEMVRQGLAGLRAYFAGAAYDYVNR